MEGLSGGAPKLKSATLPERVQELLHARARRGIRLGEWSRRLGVVERHAIYAFHVVLEGGQDRPVRGAAGLVRVVPRQRRVRLQERCRDRLPLRVGRGRRRREEKDPPSGLLLEQAHHAFRDSRTREGRAFGDHCDGRTLRVRGQRRTRGLERRQPARGGQRRQQGDPQWEGARCHHGSGTPVGQRMVKGKKRARAADVSPAPCRGKSSGTGSAPSIS